MTTKALDDWWETRQIVENKAELQTRLRRGQIHLVVSAVGVVADSCADDASNTAATNARASERRSSVETKAGACVGANLQTRTARRLQSKIDRRLPLCGVEDKGRAVAGRPQRAGRYWLIRSSWALMTERAFLAALRTYSSCRAKTTQHQQGGRLGSGL